MVGWGAGGERKTTERRAGRRRVFVEIQHAYRERERASEAIDAAATTEGEPKRRRNGRTRPPTNGRTVGRAADLDEIADRRGVQPPVWVLVEPAREARRRVRQRVVVARRLRDGWMIIVVRFCVDKIKACVSAYTVRSQMLPFQDSSACALGWHTPCVVSGRGGERVGRGLCGGAAPENSMG